jgi:ferredoxin, 2Fe-2S
MPKVKYIDYRGNVSELDGEAGQSVMRVAVDNSVYGIEADCGGACCCATCHVYVEPAWLDKIAPIGDAEAQMLEYATDSKPNSRLSCQIELTPELDGLVVHTPASQH